MKGRRVQSRHKQDGRILIELILAIPILLMIPAGVAEYARFIRLDQIAVVFSQEAASRAYRRCGDFYETVPWTAATNPMSVDVARTQEVTRACLGAVMVESNNVLQNFLPGSQIVLSVYRANLDGTSPTRMTQLAVVPDQNTTDPYQRTNYEIGEGMGGGDAIYRVRPGVAIEIITPTNAQRRQRIVVAEVAFRHSTIIPLFQAFFNSGPTTDGVFRETTIL